MSNEENSKLDTLLASTARIEANLKNVTQTVAKHNRLIEGTGSTAEPGLRSEVLRLSDAYGRFQKVFWAAICAAVSGGVGLLVTWLITAKH